MSCLLAGAVHIRQLGAMGNLLPCLATEAAAPTARVFAGGAETRPHMQPFPKPLRPGSRQSLLLRDSEGEGPLGRKHRVPLAVPVLLRQGR